jgi:hypothetical protein
MCALAAPSLYKKFGSDRKIAARENSLDRCDFGETSILIFWKWRWCLKLFASPFDWLVLPSNWSVSDQIAVSDPEARDRPTPDPELGRLSAFFAWRAVAVRGR